jgi:hypothetical protein
MDERGWAWLESEIRQVQLLEWIVPQSANTYVPIKPFYDALRDGGDLTFHVIHDELQDLERRSLIDLGRLSWSSPPTEGTRINDNPSDDNKLMQPKTDSSPSRSPDPCHLAVLARSGFVLAAPALPGASRIRLPQLRRPATAGPTVEGLSPPLESSAPHGAHG